MVLGSSDLIKSLAEINIHNEAFCLRSPAKSIPESKDSIWYIFHLYKLLTTAEIKNVKTITVEGWFKSLEWLPQGAYRLAIKPLYYWFGFSGLFLLVLGVGESWSVCVGFAFFKHINQKHPDHSGLHQAVPLELMKRLNTTES